MAASHERAQRGAVPSGVPLVSTSVSPGADGVVVLDTVINDDFAHRFQACELDYVKVLAQFRRADELDAEAAYYGHRAMQKEQAWGPGYYVDLLQALATDRSAMAQRLRACGKPPTSSVTDASFSRRHTGPVEQIDLPQPRSEGPPT